MVLVLNLITHSMYKYLLAFIVFFTGCTGSRQPIQPSDFDPEQVGAMVFQLSDSEESEWEGVSRQDRDDIAREISRRFSQAGYRVTYAKPGGGEKSDNFSHVMEVSVGAGEFTDKPSGFSFVFGDSDPRSSKFEKAFSIPVSCTLRSTENPNEAMVLEERKTMDTGLETLGLDPIEKLEKTKRFYIENIGSTCHNLLSKLQIRPTRAASVDPAKQFAPVVRIETEPENMTDHPDAELKKEIPPPEATQIQPAPNVSHRPKQEAVTDTASQREMAKPPVAIKNGQAEDWRNKKIKIFNQGDTVILKFGYERR